MSIRTAKLLMIDNASGNLKSIINSLESYPFEIVYTQDAIIGCEMASSESPHLIIIASSSHNTYEIDITVKLKAHSATKDIPIIILNNSSTSNKHLEIALDAGAWDYMRSPFDEVELLARIKSRLSMNRAYLSAVKKKHEIERSMHKERSSLQEIISQKERELTTQAIHIHEMYQFLTSLLNIVRSVKNGESEISFSIKEIEKILINKLKVRSSWQQFMTHFENVHPKFFENLKLKFPRITGNDLRLAAYMKIGMGNKEIALLTGVEPNSVKSSLRRMKKKIGLKPKDSLRDFFIYS